MAFCRPAHRSISPMLMLFAFSTCPFACPYLNLGTPPIGNMCPTELDPYHSPAGEDPTRIDSEVLPDRPIFLPTWIEVEKWQQLREWIQDGPYGTTFTQLLIVLLATLGAHMPRVTSDMLLHIFEPVHSYGDDQRKIIEQIYEMARSPDAQPVIRLHHHAQLVWRAFMEPFLPHHLPATAIYNRPSPIF